MAIASLDVESSEVAAVLERLVREDAIGQLLERRGRIAYSARFLHAQALGKLFAMRDAGRPVLLATVRRAEAPALVELLEAAAAQLG